MSFFDKNKFATNFKGLLLTNKNCAALISVADASMQKFKRREMSGTKCFLPLITGLVFLMKSTFKCFLIFRDLLESVSLFSENVNYVSYKPY